MRHILVKEGDSRPSAFSDLTELVNQPDGCEQVGFYTRVDYSMRLVRNRTSTSNEMPFALMHYMADPTSSTLNPNVFRPLDLELMATALDTYDYVLFGVVTPTHVVKDYGLIEKATYIARRADGKLIDIATEELINPNDTSVTFLTTFFGMVKYDDLPVYCVILDPGLVHATDGFDYYHQPADTMYRLITAHDGTLRNNVFAPIVKNAALFDNIIIPTADTFSIEFFGSTSIFRDAPPGIRYGIPTVVGSDQVYTVRHGINEVSVELLARETAGPAIATIQIEFNCGAFFDVARSDELPHFKYVIIRP